MGRSPEANIQLPNDADHKTISRYHCLLDIKSQCRNSLCEIK
ncbi:MAG: FHA domain-containing protein [Trichormus sp.]